MTRPRPGAWRRWDAWAESRGLSPRVSTLANQDWGRNWKKHFKPFLAVPGLVIAPPWEKPGASPGEKVLIIDPGMAFGTGQHATTWLCLDFLADLAAKAGLPQRVLDVGAGTGVVGLCAVLLGAGSALGLENDPEAVESAQRNIELNRLGHRFRVEDAGLDGLGEKFPLIVSNITRDTLIELAPLIRPRLQQGGMVALSGILREQAEDVVRAYAKLGLGLMDRRDRGDWSLLVLK